MNGPYRWVMVFLGGLMGCVAIGPMFSLAVFLDPMSAETGWSRAGISTAMTLDFLIMGAAGFLWGMLSDRHGPRPVVLAGAVLLGAGLLVASRATTPLTFQLGFGLLVGLSAGAFFAPMIAAVTGWFDTGRALAVSLVSAGMGMAPMTMTPFAGWLISSHDWRTAMAAMLQKHIVSITNSLQALQAFSGHLTLLSASIDTDERATRELHFSNQGVQEVLQEFHDAQR